MTKGRWLIWAAAAVGAACSTSAVIDDDGGAFSGPSSEGGAVITGDASIAPDDDASTSGDDDGGSVTDASHPIDAPQGDSASGANGKLVINEVDYDELNSDDAEYVELYNPSASAAVSLSGLAVIFVAGGSQAGEYARVALGSASLPAHGYLVVAAPGVSVHDAGTVQVIRFSMTTNNIQNGRAAPAAVAILDTASNTLVDALSYGGALRAPFNFVEGAPTTVTDSNDAGGSLIRNPNGKDTGNASSDWAFTTTLTPGASNVLSN